MSYFIRAFCLLFMSLNAYAETTIPANLIKVTKENNPHCVEYVTYQGEMYCTKEPIDNAPVDPKLVALEKQKIQFDNRPWKSAWGKEKGLNLTLEYIPMGDTINQWQELVTSQFFAGLTEVSAQDFANSVIKQLQQTGFTIETSFIEQGPNQVILEFKVKDPVNMRQDELQKIVRGKDGMYVLHYAIKKADMGAENRAKWLLLLQQSSLR